MKKPAFTLIEITFVFILILIVSALVIPLVVNESKTVRYVNNWRNAYSDILYIFGTMEIYHDEEYKKNIANKIAKTKDSNKIEEILIEEFRPYFRITDKVSNKKYHQKYLNNEKIKDNQYYYFKNVYHTSTEQIIGIKWIKDLYEDSPILMLMIDINGKNPPNCWGKDLFGINIYKNKIEPFGKNMSKSDIDMDCSKKGRGIYCSYKYLIGAQF